MPDTRGSAPALSPAPGAAASPAPGAAASTTAASTAADGWTAAASPDGARRQQRAGRTGLVLLTVVLAALAATVWAAAPHSGTGSDQPFALVALLAAFVGAELSQVHVEVRRQTYSMSLVEMVLVAGLFLVAPHLVLVARLGAGVLVFAMRRTALQRVVVNLAMFAAETSVALAVFPALSRPGDLGWHAWLAAYAAVLTSDLVSGTSVLVAIRLVEGRLTARELATIGPVLLATGLLTITLGCVVVVAVHADPGSVLLLAVLGGVLAAAYRAYAALVRRHASLGEVFAFTELIGQARSQHDLSQVLLRETRRLLGARTAVLRLVDATGTTVVGGLRDDTDQPGPEVLGAGGPMDAFEARVVRGESALLPRGSTDPWARDWLRRAGLRDAVVVPLLASSGVLGWVEVGDRLGEMHTFTEEDRRLAETLAAHAAVAFENGRLLERSVYEGTHDSLTRLPNRALFAERLQDVLDAGGLRAAPAVLLLDLSRFKEVNDTLGHAGGDRVLARLAGRLRDACPAPALVARFPGDEFGVLLPRTAADDDPREPGAARGADGTSAVLAGAGTASRLERAADVALAEAVRLLTTLREPFDVDGLVLEVDACVGICVGSGDLDAATVLRRADVAMYAAKEAVGSLAAWHPSMESSSPRRLALVGELRRAVARGELVLHYQPQVALPGGAPVGVEALVRWQHPTYGLLPPDEFVPLAERTGIIVPLTAAVLRLAVAQCSRWLAEGRRLPVAVNLSARGLLDPHLPATVAGLLREYDVPPQLLALEITETQVMSDVARTLPILSDLHATGVSLSVDDFGTGYSSLAYLRRLPVDEVKIDKSFVLEMGSDPGDAAIVETIVGLAHQLRLRVVAEGVEDEASRDLLLEMGCDVAQGYLISRPMPADRLREWLTARGAAQRGPAQPASHLARVRPLRAL